MAKLTGTHQVDEFMQRLEHPLKREIEEVRRMLQGMDRELAEQVKWNAPSFCYRNEDRVTFNLRGNGFFRLVLHRGAKASVDSVDMKPYFEDIGGLMEWAANDRATIKLTGMEDIEAKSGLLIEAVRRWVDIE
ncbi:DUF1801 domain-containing protein [Paenibacillus soyae]|uniref:DUF1801 domain-containing protein n=1 Tax=Paenibacillus soyae TaxID=2969249 RepID=UPI00214A4712